MSSEAQPCHDNRDFCEAQVATPYDEENVRGRTAELDERKLVAELVGGNEQDLACGSLVVREDDYWFSSGY